MSASYSVSWWVSVMTSSDLFLTVKARKSYICLKEARGKCVGKTFYCIQILKLMVEEAVNCGQGEAGRLMGAWRWTVCWLQSFPVFAGHQIVQGRPLTNEARVPIPHLSLAICACVITLTNETIRCLLAWLLSEKAELLLGFSSVNWANFLPFSLICGIFSYKTTEILNKGMHWQCNKNASHMVCCGVTAGIFSQKANNQAGPNLSKTAFNTK